MERIGKKFSSFKEADKAERKYYRSLTADQRLLIARELLQQVHGDLSRIPDVREYELQRKDT